MGGGCKHDFGRADWYCKHCGAGFTEVAGWKPGGFIDEEALHKEQANRAAEAIMTEYAQGGYVGPPVDEMQAFPLTKPLMSLASYRALAPDMREKLDVELVISAAEACELGAEALKKLQQ